MGRVTGASLRGATIGRPGLGRRGYRPADVDDFLARAADALDARALGRPADLSADDVHAVVFRKPRLGEGRGYSEDEVDALLDAVELALRGGSGGIELNGHLL